MKFSPIVADGVNALIAQESEASEYSWTRAMLIASLGTRADCSEIWHHDTLIGYWVAQRVLDETTLLNFVIFKPYQSKGFGQLAITQILQRLAQADTKTVFLEVRASNFAAKKVYEKAGFETMHRRKNYYACGVGREDALTMCRRL